MIILPNILWQYNHGWPVVYHMSELKKTQMVNMTISNFLIDLFSLNLASSLIWITGLISLLFLKQEKRFQYIGVASLLIILVYLISEGKGYYILGLLPFLFAFGAYTMEKYFKGRLIFINYLVLFITLSFSLIALPFGIPVLPFDKLLRYAEKTKHLIIYPFYRWEDGKIHNISQIYADMTGWHELTGYVGKAYNQLSQEDQKKCTIFIEENYGDAGAIHFYGKEFDLPQPITFLDSYIIWAPDTISDGPIIYIYFQPGGFNTLFNNIVEIGCVSDKYFRESGLKVFLCSDPKRDVPEVYRQKVIKEKRIYRRNQ
jgi:hypothetical protein